MTASRYTLQIDRIGNYTGAWNDHHVYEIYAQPNQREDLTTSVNIQRWAAGVLGRLAAELTGGFADEQRDCGCPNVCNIKAVALIIDRDSMLAMETDQPSIQFVVRRERAKHWQQTLKAAIDRINKADRWEPTESDERRWARRYSDTSTEHYAPPAIPVTTTTKEQAR